jgi:hypothetical protein
MRLSLLIFMGASLLLCSCASIRRDVSEVDPYATYERTSDGDQIVTVGGHIILRDPSITGLKK